jgi:hypothetical protein
MATPTPSNHDSTPRPAAVETVRGLIEQVADMPVSEDADILLAELEALYTRLGADAARVAELEALVDRFVKVMDRKDYLRDIDPEADPAPDFDAVDVYVELDATAIAARRLLGGAK